MSKTTIRIYKESDGSVPLVEWLDGQPEKVQDKFTALIELLGEKGYDLRRPHCDFLESGVYELRARYLNVQYRILYGFVAKSVVLLSHGCTKESKVPKKDIKQAVENLDRYKSNPGLHTYIEAEL
jgi:phage-related protein